MYVCVEPWRIKHRTHVAIAEHKSKMAAAAAEKAAAEKAEADAKAEAKAAEEAADKSRMETALSHYSKAAMSMEARLKAEEGDKDKPAEKVTEWRIFTLKPVISLICWQVASNFLFAVLQILGPTYYTGTLKVSPERAGVLLALAQLVNFVSAAALVVSSFPHVPSEEAVAQPGTALGGMAEAMMLKRMLAPHVGSIVGEEDESEINIDAPPFRAGGPCDRRRRWHPARRRRSRNSRRPSR